MSGLMLAGNVMLGHEQRQDFYYRVQWTLLSTKVQLVGLGVLREGLLLFGSVSVLRV